MNFLLHLFLLFQVVNCQEKSLINCSSNFYRYEDSICKLCIDDACKTGFQNFSEFTISKIFEMNLLLDIFLFPHFLNYQEKLLINCSIKLYRDEDSICKLCDKDACKTVLQNKDTKYEACRGFCSSKADPKQYVTATIPRHQKTPKQNKLLQKATQFRDKSLMKTTTKDWGSLATTVISMIMGGLVIGVVTIMLTMIFYHQKKNKIGGPLNPISSTSNPLMAVRIPENDNGNERPLDSSCSIDSTKRILMETGKKYGEGSNDNAKTPLMDGKSPENDNDNETSTTSGYPNESIKTPVMKTGQRYTEVSPGSNDNANIPVNSTCENEKDNERTTESGYSNDSAPTPVINGGQQQPDENDDDNETPLPNCSDGSVFGHLNLDNNI